MVSICAPGLDIMNISFILLPEGYYIRGRYQTILLTISGKWRIRNSSHSLVIWYTELGIMLNVSGSGATLPPPHGSAYLPLRVSWQEAIMRLCICHQRREKICCKDDGNPPFPLSILPSIQLILLSSAHLTMWRSWEPIFAGLHSKSVNQASWLQLCNTLHCQNTLLASFTFP